MHCLPQRLKSTFFEKNLNRASGPEETSRVIVVLMVSKNFKKTLMLAFEVIVQPPKHTFEIGIFFVRAPNFCSIQTDNYFLTISQWVLKTQKNMQFREASQSTVFLIFFEQSSPKRACGRGVKTFFFVKKT